MTTRYRPESAAYLDQVRDQLDQEDATGIESCRADFEGDVLHLKAWGYEPFEAVAWLIDNTARPSIHRLQEVRRT